MVKPSLLIILTLSLLLLNLGCRLGQRTASTVDAANATISDIKEYYLEGRITTIQQDYRIQASVVVPPSVGNFSRRIILQDETGGIELALASKLPDGLSLIGGSQVILNAQGLAVGGFGGVVRIGKVDSSASGKFEGLSPASLKSRMAVIGRTSAALAQKVDVYALRPSHFSTLVQVCGLQAATADTAGTFADATSSRARNVRLTDCRGNNLIMRTGGQASFAEAPLPSGQGCVTGIVTAYRGQMQIQLRSLAGISLNGPRCKEPATAEELKLASLANAVEARDTMVATFEGLPDRVPFALLGWSTHTTAGSKAQWQARQYKGNGYLQVSAYNDTADSVTSWLITPKLNTASAKTLTLRSAQAYFKHAGLTVLYSTDYVPGQAPSGATWQELPVAVADNSTDDNEWVATEAISLPNHPKGGYIGFRYQGSKRSGKTTTFRLDDVMVEPY